MLQTHGTPARAEVHISLFTTLCVAAYYAGSTRL